MKTALLCSGQGSQYVGMIKDLYDSNSMVKDLVNKADDILGFELSKICFDGPLETLKETRYTQPALFLHSSVVYNLLKEKLEFHATAGHSVGEYAALYASGVLSFDDALKLVALRGRLMFQAGEHLPGTMFAVLGLENDDVVKISEELTSKGNGNVVVAANFNSPGQVVVSGSAEYLRDNVSAFKDAGARLVKELIVSGAFHSPLMQPAKEELERAINETEFADANVPIYTNVFAKSMSSSSDLKDALIKQLTAPVLWTQTMETMKSDGIERYIEIGAGKVLQGLAKRSLKDIEIAGVDKSEDLSSLLS